MSIDWEFLRILRKPREPKPEPCSKDAGCVQATATRAAQAAAYRVAVKQMQVVDEDQEFVIMCAWCGRIKEDGKWVVAEVFECKITHTICPDCFEKQKAEILEESNG